MSEHEWQALTKSEEAFMVNSYEIDILAGVWGDLDDADQSRPVKELAGILLTLIDRGWIEVRRVAPWTSPFGEQGLQPGELVPRDQLPAVLEDAANWEYPDDGNWIGAVTLVETEAGKKITRRSPRRRPSRAPWRGSSGRCSFYPSCSVSLRTLTSPASAPPRADQTCRHIQPARAQLLPPVDRFRSRHQRWFVDGGSGP